MTRPIKSIWAASLLAVAFTTGAAQKRMPDPSATAVSGPAPEVLSAATTGEPASEVSGAQAAFALPWYSINGGGVLNASSASYRASQSIGQSVVGKASSPSYGLGIGFWYGVAAFGACPIALTGDVNRNGTVTSSDIIYMVNHVFKGGPAPLPCSAAGDVNCNGSLTSADIIYLVNYVFKGGAAPCDGCTSPLAAAC